MQSSTSNDWAHSKECVGLNERDVHVYDQREVFIPASEGS